MATKKKKTATNLVLVDRSDSMSGRTKAVVTGLGAFIDNLKAEVPDSRLILVFFNTEYTVVFDGAVCDLQDQHKGYNADGGTALWGSLLKSLGTLTELTADYKSLTVISDGLDMGNAHWCFDASQSKVVEAIKQARTAKINVGLLSTGIDGMALAKTLGIDAGLSAEFKGDSVTTQNAVEQYSKSVARSSTGKRAALTTLERASITQSPEELAAANAEELVTLNKAAKLLQTMYENDVNQFFSVTFKKRTPPFRLRTYAKARFHVVSKMKKADGSGAAYNFLEKKLVPVWVMDENTDPKKGKVGDPEGFRSIPLDGLIAVRAQGKAFRVKTGG